MSRPARWPTIVLPDALALLAAWSLIPVGVWWAGVDFRYYATYARVVKHFGERGAVDLIGVIGYYTLVSMVLNVDRVPIPGGAPAPLPLID